MNEILKKPRKIYVTRTIEFNAAHRLFNPDLDESENSRIYGKCGSFYGHGHNYQLEITLSGMVDPVTGYLFDLKELKKILEKEIIARFDHKHLNHDVPELSECVPTTEVLAILIWDILEKQFNTINHRKLSLYEVTIHETGKNAVRYRGE